MTTMIAEVYEAFISAGADEKKAKAAAEALSSEQLATRSDIIKIERELAVLKWMVVVYLFCVSQFLQNYLLDDYVVS